MSSVTNLSTSGLQLRRGSRPVRSLVELLSSMRFAISLLVVVAIASIIGTVLKQGEPLNNYIDQFGPFWAAVFHRLGLFQVYSSWWFLLIMAILVVSTTLCLVRNTPKIIADLRSFKTGVREQNLRAFHDKAEADFALPRAAAVARIGAALRARGYALRLREGDGETLIAAKAGGLGRIGYILAHSAFVLICLGGLFDGDVVIRLQMALTGKQMLKTNMAIDQVPQRNILSPANPTYRGNISIPEGSSADVAVINLGDGSVLQPLPFTIKLKKFIVDYYSTGMPRLFASDVLITDHRSGKTWPATIKVNEPLNVDGVNIFQSGFDDGGSHLQLHAWPMRGAGDKGFAVAGDVGSTRQLSNGRSTLRLELSSFRLLNVENMSTGKTDKTDKGGLLRGIDRHLGAAVERGSSTKLTNVGPAVVYKLRDASGQANEFINYMLPIQLDGMPMFVAGERSEVGGQYRYLRIPADADGKIDDWMRLRAALADPDARRAAVDAYVKQALPANATKQLATQLEATAGRTLDLFAGDLPRDPKTGAPLVSSAGGLPALGEFLQRNVPKDQLNKASDVFIRVLNGVLWQLWSQERQHAGLPPLHEDEATNRYFNAAVLALSDASFYPAPLFLQLTGFKQVQASVFQVARAPGKVIVYFGAVLLILGVFTMLYIRERRAWFLLRDADGGSRALMAMSTNRRTMDFEKEFATLRAATLDATAMRRD
jgi:cytochrome c biogenesis protein